MLATLAVPLALLFPAAQYPTVPAPDGAPSFGREPELRAVEGLFRNPGEKDQEFLAGLRDLVVEIHTQFALAEALAAKRGLMVLLPPVPPGPPGSHLEALLDHVRPLARDPFGKGLNEEQSIALTRFVGDGQLLAYAPLIEAAREEVPLLLAALDLLHGHTHGLVQLDEGTDLKTITAFADFSAARLRTVRKDLQSLAQPLHGALPPLQFEQVRVARGISEAANSLRKGYFELRAAGTQQLKFVKSLSDLKSFDEMHAAQLGDRRRARTASVAVQKRLPRFLPIYDTQRAVVEPWADMSSSERARLAVRLGTDALAADPLNGNLSYLVALGVEFSSGKKAAEPFLDRFLVIQGIRHYDHRTFMDRELDAFQEYALVRIADWTPNNAGR